MGNRAIYTLVEQGETSHFYSHWGANALSPIFRLQQAREIQEQIQKPIAHIFEHLSRKGEYVSPRLPNAEMFCDSIGFDKNEPRQGSDIEMFITLDLDKKMCELDFNECYKPYKTMGIYNIPLDVMDKALKISLDYAEKNYLTEFSELVKIFNKCTKLDVAIEESRVNAEAEDYLNSPEAKEQQNQLKEMTGEENQEEGQEV